MRLSGHGLRLEGRAHDAHGHFTRGFDGYGLCTCGVRSDWLGSDAARQRWHRQHKADVAASRDARVLGSDGAA